MQPLDPALVALATATCVAYAWLGICYASTMMLVATLAGYSLRHCLASILLAQVATALTTSVARLSEVKRVERVGVASSGVVMGLSALASLLAAALLGTKLSDSTRLLANAAILIVTAAINAVTPSTRSSANPKQAAFIGILAGFVKGALGGGSTGVLLAGQRLLGVNFDRATHATLIAHLAMCLAALGPYTATQGIDLHTFTSLTIGSLIGCAIGQAIPRTTNTKQRIAASTATTIAIATLMTLKALTTT